MAMQGYGTYDMPPDVAAEQQRIARQQAIAEAMLQRSMAPIQQQGAPIHWTQGLAQLFNAYTGRRGMDETARAQGALGQRYQQGLADEVARIAKMRGQTIQPDPQEFEQSADQGTPVPQPGQTGDPRAAVMAALTSQYGPVREMGKLDFQADMKQRDAREAQAARLHERQLILEAQAQNAALDRAAREQAQREANQIKALIASLAAQSRGAERSPFYTFIGTPQGIVVGNARTGQLSLGGVDGKPIMKASDSPQLQGQITAAKTTGKAAAERAFNMAGIGSVIKQAEDILGNKAKPPTGSGAGSIADKVAGFFGQTLPGGAAAQQLKAVAGALTAKMPRMEGPQSDRDVQLYRESAGQVGDDTLPVEQRLSALQVVKNLWLKYESLNPDAFTAGGGPNLPGGAPAGVDPAVWAVMTPEERALWQK